MIIKLKGHENCRGRPPTQGDCREGPADIRRSEGQTLPSGTQGSAVAPASYDALAIKRRWGEFRAAYWPPGSMVYPHACSTAASATRVAFARTDTGFLYPEHWSPPWKSWHQKARDWISCTLPERTTGNRSGTTKPAHHPAIPPSPKSDTGCLCPFANQTKTKKTGKDSLTNALILHIKA